jgi:protein arginine kinase activator
MKCQICKKAEATIHVTNMVGDKVEKLHLCRKCAEEKGYDYIKKSNFKMGDLLSGLVSSSQQSKRDEKDKRVCPNCGMDFNEFERLSRLGCSDCYGFFRIQLLPLLRSIHGDTRHVGKFPKRLGEHVELRRNIDRLRDKLERAVEVEDYEKAAKLRDEINSLKEKVESEK